MFLLACHRVRRHRSRLLTKRFVSRESLCLHCCFRMFSFDLCFVAGGALRACGPERRREAGLPRIPALPLRRGVPNSELQSCLPSKIQRFELQRFNHAWATPTPAARVVLCVRRAATGGRGGAARRARGPQVRQSRPGVSPPAEPSPLGHLRWACSRLSSCASAAMGPARYGSPGRGYSLVKLEGNEGIPL